MSAKTAVDVLVTADPAAMAAIEASGALQGHIIKKIDACEVVVGPDFLAHSPPQLTQQILLRYPKRAPQHTTRCSEAIEARCARLHEPVRAVLVRAMRHAVDGTLFGWQAWDPLHDASSVRALFTAGLITQIHDDHAYAPYSGRYRLHADLPTPPPVPYNLHEAVMPETDDLPAPGLGTFRLLHDMASLSAAIECADVRTTATGDMTVASVRKIAGRLLEPAMSSEAQLRTHGRWGTALRALDALAMIDRCPIRKTIHLDLALEDVLQGSTLQAADRLIHRLIDRDLHPIIPAIRAAIAAANHQAIDELIFYELIAAQHRDIVFSAWSREGVSIYPSAQADQRPIPYDDASWAQVEVPMLSRVITLFERIGLLRRSRGIFAPTQDGLAWATAASQQAPPLWVTGDMEIMVAPDALSVWERLQLERIATPLQRDTVDRFRLTPGQLRSWLTTHDLAEFTSILKARCPVVPAAFMETLTRWAHDATRIVLWRGIVLNSPCDAAGER